MNIIIITGGTSSERKISFMSANQVKKALEASGFKAELFDLKQGYKHLKKVASSFDVIFPMIHGEAGEGGRLYKFLAPLKKPYVGGDWKGFKKGWYKISFKKFCDANGILTASWKRTKSKSVIEKFGFPTVLKASNGGSSKEVVILKSAADLNSKECKKLLRSGAPLFVERYLNGVEVTVGILGNDALPVIEIIPPKGGWFDYKNKYWGKVKEIPHAPSLTGKQKRAVQKIALKIHQDLNLGHYSRIDFIIADGKAYALEVNTIPGMTAASLLPKAAQAAGISFEQLVDKLVKMALKSPPLKSQNPQRCLLGQT